MILPMKKYYMLVHHSGFHEFVKNLQKLGVVDVVDRGVEPDEGTNCEIQRVQQFDRVINVLEPFEEEGTPEKTDLMPGKILKIILQSQGELDELKQRIAQLEKHYRALRPWGNFSPKTFKNLEENGFYLRFFSVSQRRFKPEWLAEYNTEIINETEGQTFFVIVQREKTDINIDADEVKAPERPAGDVKKEIGEIKGKIQSTENFFREHARAYLPKLRQARTQTENRISFDEVKLNATSEAEDHLKIIEGWVPETKLDDVNKFLDEEGIFYMVQDPVKGEKVPVMLKNNKYSRLFEPIGKLYSLPAYQELDLTPFFAPFFMLFFGFCLGDAGYGLIFIIGATIMKPRVKQEMKKFLTLAQWLGGTTIIFGIITGTFFGINLIESLKGTQIEWLQTVRGYMLDSNKMFYFALILGGIQIVYGMGIKAANQARMYGFKHALSTLGWMLIIIGGAILFALSNVISKDLVRILAYVLLGISGVFILFMNSPGKNILVNLGGGIWDIYSVVTGVLGDLLSYIRLFALGVSSAILGYVFNDLAMQMSGNTPVVSQFFFVLILLVGHGLNIFMASLGSFVHPMRLTFVEFYKNAGFMGGGKPYKPFRQKEV